jgi:hypothetical protein
MWWVISGEGPSAVLRAALRLPHTQIPVGARPGCLISISSADARFLGYRWQAKLAACATSTSGPKWENSSSYGLAEARTGEKIHAAQKEAPRD